MRKKIIARSLFLTPICAFLMSYATYFAISYPKSHIELLRHIDSSIAFGESFLQKDEISPDELEAKIIAKLEKQKTSTEETGMTRQTAMKVLDSTVRINSGSSIGSGILLFEEKIDDIIYTYVITNAHVVPVTENIFIEKFTYLKEQTISSTEKYPAIVVSKDTDIDLAILQIKTPESIGTIATFQTRELETNIKLYQRVYLSGCPLGEPPLITTGHVGLLSPIHIRVTAFSIFGNSGGGAFDRDGKLIGIVKGIAVLELDKTHRLPEPNLTYVISGPLVRSWILLSDLTFILGDQPGRTHKTFLVKQKEALLKEKE